MSSRQASRLRDHVLARRRELDMTQVEVWQAGGPSNTTLTKIENGVQESLTRKTARALDVGLQWEPGSARRVWQGGDPTPLLPGSRPETSARLRQIIELDPDIDSPTRERLLDVLDRRTGA